MLWGDYWRIRSGQITANVRLATNGPVEFEIWNDTTGVQLARSILTSTSGIVATKSINANLVNHPPAPAYAGSWPFVVQPVEPPQEDVIEIRILNPNITKTSIYSIGLSTSRSQP